MRNRVPLAGMLPSHDEFNIGDLVYVKLAPVQVEGEWQNDEALALIIDEAVPGIYTVQPVNEPQQRRNTTTASMRKANDNE